MTIKTGTRQANYRLSTLYIYTIYMDVKGLYPESGFYSLDKFYSVPLKHKFKGLDLSLLVDPPQKQQRVDSDLEALVPH
jgi:hypothetical protein